MAGRRVTRRNEYGFDRSDLTAAVKCYLTRYLPQHRGASANTISSYGHALRSLLGFLSRRGRRKRRPISRDLTAENILTFLARLEEEHGNGPSTRNVRLAAIRSFMHFAFLMGCLGKRQHERLLHIAFKRSPPKLPAYLEVHELEAVFRSVDYSTRDGFRNLVVLKLMYNTGARASEVASVRVSGLELDDLHVWVTGKGGKRRLCCLWETTAALIRIYLDSERRPPARGFEDFLFVDQRRKRFTRFGIHYIVRRCIAKAASSCPSLAKKNVTPHSLRHTTGVHLVRVGVDLNTIRELLGHAHISSTEIYARAGLAMKRSALARLKPLDAKLFNDVAASRGVSDVDPGIRTWLESLDE
ncbi:MAG: tyrosine-type recombinase/integrase [Planctomycetota bacterium]|jgi:site-specific recombinase XerD